MRIGVVGSDSAAEVVRRVERDSLTGLEFVYRCSEILEETTDLVQWMQDKEKIDAILFTGPTNYEYARKRIAPKIPWSYIPHSRMSVFRALLEAVTVYKSDLKAISVDRYEEDIIREALRSVGVDQSMILYPSFEPNEEDYRKKLYLFHKECWQKGVTSIALTSMGNLSELLRRDGIPCIRILAAEEVIRERIMQLKMSDISSQNSRGKMAVVLVLFDYVFDREMDFRLREWEKLQYQNQCREHIYSIAQRVDAAVFEEGFNCFYMVTDRNLFMSTFTRNEDFWKLLHFAQTSPEYMVWMGIGIGDTVLEAKSRAAHAANCSRRDSTGSAYLVGEENEIQGPFRVSREPDRGELSTDFLAHRLRIGPETMEKLREALKEFPNGEFTSEELAVRLGITRRSTDRILRRLEENGYTTVVGKKSLGKGRPSRVVKVEDVFLGPAYFAENQKGSADGSISDWESLSSARQSDGNR